MTDEQERCRLCPAKKAEAGTWICCDACETWYHVRCLKMSPEEFEVIDQYHCADCTPKAGPSTLLRKSSRRTGKINYADLVNGIVSHQSKWRVILDSHQFLPDKFERVAGKDVTLDRLRSSDTSFKYPMIVKLDQDGTTNGLDMKMPPTTLTVDDVRDAVGADTPVEVIDVATQSDLLDWNMGSWAEYFKTVPKERVYNVISLEITGTPLADQIRRPRVVRELDWIENFWPKALKPTEFPKVQLYCLMSVKDSYTDFHIDFAGSSVFYHILSGSKTFYFVEPTSTHLRKYAKWSSSADQSTTFFGDEVAGKCYKVELQQGDTMLIPAGWIHAVYTPTDSVVIGGNFIHSLHIPMQYRICDIEQETNVPPKFRFPFFEKLNWFVAKGCLERGQDYLSTLSIAELRGYLKLTVHLFGRQRKLKHEGILKEERHMIKASVPAKLSAYVNGGPIGLLRDLNQQVCRVLEGLNMDADMTSGVVIDKALRLMTEEEERLYEKEQVQKASLEMSSSAKPKIKLRIKLNSTTSSTNSGDEESSQAEEQQVPSSSASTPTTATTGIVSFAADSRAPTPVVPKLKLKLPLLSATGKKSSTIKSESSKPGRVSKSGFKKKPSQNASLYESGSGLDDSDSDLDLGQDLDLQLTSDEEWTEFESQIDEGFDEAKEDEGDDDLDDGEMDFRSSDSEYDGGGKRRRRANRRRGSSHMKSSSTATVTATAARTPAPKARLKWSSSETVYFGDDGDGDGDFDTSPDYVDMKESLKRDSEDDDEVVLGLGKKRKLTPMQFSALLTSPSSSMPKAATSSASVSTSASVSGAVKKKVATSGTTAKDRIKSLLLKRR